MSNVEQEETELQCLLASSRQHMQFRAHKNAQQRDLQPEMEIDGQILGGNRSRSMKRLTLYNEDDVVRSTLQPLVHNEQAYTLL